MLVGLYLSPRSAAPLTPLGLRSGVPSTPVNGVLLDCRPLGAAPDAVVAAIRTLAPSPDLLLLVDVESSLVPSIVEAFGMEKSYHAELFQRAQPNLQSGAKIGVCVLSRHPLFEGTPVRLDRRVVGVEAVMVVEERAMQVRCVAIDDQGEPPAPTVKPESPADAAPQLLLSGGRIGGVWTVSLTKGVSMESQPELSVIRRKDSPAAIAFSVGRLPATKATTGPATASTAPATRAAPASGPATDRAE